MLAIHLDDLPEQEGLEDASMGHHKAESARVD